MKLEQSFEVSAPLQRVWEALIDVERVAPCLPGAAVTGRNDDGSYNGEFKVKIGPTSAAYSGKLHMESVDEQAHNATMQAAGTDKRGQGGAKATIESSVEEVDAGTTKVNVATDYHITGRLARFGRGGMIEEISNRLLREFATRLQAMLAGDETGAAREPGEAGASVAGTAGAAAATATAAGTDDGGREGGGDDGGRQAGGDRGGAAESDAAPAEVAEAADEPPVPQAGSKGEPADPAHASEATADSEASGQPASAGEDEFAPPAPPPPPSGAAAGAAPPPPPSETDGPPAPPPPPSGAAARPAPPPSGAAGAGPPPPPPAGAAGAEPPPPPPPPPSDNEPMQGLSLVGGALVSQVKSNPAPFVGALVALLVVFRLLRRRARG
ncbi:MAG TPA: SRPBCC family protein [Solirubrobacteraceae bacterium]|nr:SRPBCC family protein [Solirubrobacteraceae bacterium]